MPRVTINTGNHEVEVEDPKATLQEVARVAKRLWDQTEPPHAEVKPGPATGFMAERRAAATLLPMDVDGR